MHMFRAEFSEYFPIILNIIVLFLVLYNTYAFFGNYLYRIEKKLV